MSPDVAASVRARLLNPARQHGEEFDLATRWRNYLAAGAVLIPPPVQFGDIGERIIRFLGPVRDSIVGTAPFVQTWPPGGPWRPSEASA